MRIYLRREADYLYCKDWLVGESHPEIGTVIYKQKPVDWFDVPNNECSMIEAEEEEKFHEQLLDTMFYEGFWWAVRNPIDHHPDGGILVVADLALSPEVCFSSPWTPPENGYNQSPWCYGFFARPVPLKLKPNYLINPYWVNRMDANGFCADVFLKFAEDCFDD